MGKSIAIEVRAAVEAMLPLFTSNKKLLEHLISIGKSVSLATIERIRREKKLEAAGWTTPPKKNPKQCTPHPYWKQHVKKIMAWIDGLNTT